MNFSKLLQVIFLLVIFCLALTLETKKSKSYNLMRKFRKQLKSAKINAKFLRELECYVTPNKVTSTSVPRMQHVFLRCNNIQHPRTISSVLCDRKCRDPVTGERLQRFYGVAVGYSTAVRKNDGTMIRLRIPGSCICELKSKT